LSVTDDIGRTPCSFEHYLVLQKTGGMSSRPPPIVIRASIRSRRKGAWAAHATTNIECLSKLRKSWALSPRGWFLECRVQGGPSHRQDLFAALVLPYPFAGWFDFSVAKLPHSKSSATPQQLRVQCSAAAPLL